MSTNVLPLYSARGQWVEGENSNQWDITDDQGQHLAFFPRHWNERDVMTAIRFGRIYEQNAYAAGIASGRDQAEQTAEHKLQELRQQVRVLLRMNEDLSEQLERIIG